MIPLLLLAAVTFGQQIINGVQNFHGIGILLPKSSGRLTALIHKKLRRIDPVYFEDTDFLDDLNKAREGIRAITMFRMIVFVCVSFYGVYFLSIGVYLFRLKPMLIITLAVTLANAALFILQISGNTWCVGKFLHKHRQEGARRIQWESKSGSPAICCTRFRRLW